MLGNILKNFMKPKEKQYSKLEDLDKVEIEIKDTPEKYLEMKDELVKFLVEILLQLTNLEELYFSKNSELEKKKIKNGIPKSQLAPGTKELWQEYKNKYKEIISSKCTEELINKGYATHIGYPSTYSYLKKGCKLVFCMKSADKAIIEAYYTKGVDEAHQFILKNTDDGWKISELKYKLQSDEKWMKISI